MKHKGGKRSPGGLGGSGVLDRNLVPRIEAFAHNNDYNDVDEVADYLRRNYKEYQRKQTGPFRQMVYKAIQILQARGGVSKPELKLQVNGLECSLVDTSRAVVLCRRLRSSNGAAVLSSTVCCLHAMPAFKNSTLMWSFKASNLPAFAAFDALRVAACLAGVGGAAHVRQRRRPQQRRCQRRR